MNATTMTQHRRALLTLLLLMLPFAPAFGQTCAAPIEISGPQMSFDGNTCSNTNTLPQLANGALTNRGPTAVYHLAIAPNSNVTAATLTPTDGKDLTLYLCRSPCSTYSTCVAVVDNGAGAQNTANLPTQPGDYYIVVGAITGEVCGTYHLAIVAPLND